ncbi:ion transporter, partial [Rhizobium sp.]|uniref:ion transporter n=1 Tax=Rhizobium sp. TaxID=391 RepID=UPI003F7E63A6
MSALSFSKISSSLSTLLAAIGLLTVAVLTTPDIVGQTRLILEVVLAGVWAIYVLQLIETLVIHRAREVRGRIPEIAVDILAVLVPLAAFLLIRGRDQSLYCAIWLLKPLRGSTFFRLLGRVLTKEARNLIGVTSIFGIVLFAAALAAYIIERDVQPDKFGSIPLAMWWAVTTLSTTGYGDEIPQSLAGRT